MSDKFKKKLFALGVMGVCVLIAFFTSDMSLLARVAALLLIGGFVYKMLEDELPHEKVEETEEPVEEPVEDVPVEPAPETDAPAPVDETNQ